MKTTAHFCYIQRPRLKSCRSKTALTFQTLPRKEHSDSEAWGWRHRVRRKGKWKKSHNKENIMLLEMKLYNVGTPPESPRADSAHNDKMPNMIRLRLEQSQTSRQAALPPCHPWMFLFLFPHGFWEPPLPPLSWPGCLFFQQKAGVQDCFSCYG